MLEQIIFNNITSTLNSSLSNSEETSNNLIISGKNEEYSVAVKVLISIFLVLAYFDFAFQTALLLYVFGKLCKTLKTLEEKLFAALGITVYTALRCTLVLFFILPIPYHWAPSLPPTLVEVLTYLNISLFTTFFGFSSLTCLYYLAFRGVAGKKASGPIVDKITGVEPIVIVLMPIYNEEPDALFRAVESAIRCNYRSDKLHIFLAFDESAETALYFALLKKLRVLSKEVSDEIKYKLQQIPENDCEAKKAEIFPRRLEWYIEGVRVTICRFPHEGKSPTQGKSFKIINELYGENEDPAVVANTLVLFIDSDVILHENAIHNFVATAVSNPKICGMTGLVTCRTSRSFNMYQYLQDAEYVDGQMFARTSEATLGAVTCLPGALTLIRLNALRTVAPKYFVDIDKRRTIDFHRFHLGEDRYMTYLLTEQAEGAYKVRFESNATCKTDAPDTFQKLLKQRRRWFLGGFVNDVSTMISPIMWKKVPLVVLANTYFYSCRGFSWILPVMLISIIASSNPGIALYIFAGTLGLRYFLLCCTSLLMTRTKVCISFIPLFLVSPFFSWTVNLYAVWTWGVRSWGGPRTDQSEDVTPTVQVLDEVMDAKEEKIGKTRKSLDQIRTISRAIGHKLSNNGSLRSISQETPVAVKKFVPFPYETEFLGGGDYDMNRNSVFVPPSTSSPRRISSASSISPSESVGDTLDLSALTSSNVPYLFAKLSPEIQRKVSSFRLDMDNLAKMGSLATGENSPHRESTFNLRLSNSGRSTPASSREPSVFNFDMDDNNTRNAFFINPGHRHDQAEASFTDDEIVDIMIQVPHFTGNAPSPHSS